MSGEASLSRLAGAGGLTWGTVLLADGDEAWHSIEHRTPDDIEQVAIRALGVRHLVQGFAQLTAPRAASGPVIIIDLVHAASMAALAAASPRHRRAAMVTGSVALVSAGLTHLSRRRGRP